MKKATLIVDDEPNIIKLLSAVLTVEGYNTLSATNGKEAVDLASGLKPDLIIMDIHLPRMDGLTATVLLKNNPETRHIPIIAISGFGMPEDVKSASDAGCDGYICKPFNLSHLREKIAEFLSE